MVGTPSQIPKHSNKSSFGIVSHLACYARVGPDGDSHGEWEKKKKGLELVPPARRAGNVTTHLFVRSWPCLSGLS